MHRSVPNTGFPLPDLKYTTAALFLDISDLSDNFLHLKEKGVKFSSTQEQ